jgi:hypothetical protein
VSVLKNRRKTPILLSNMTNKELGARGVLAPLPADGACDLAMTGEHEESWPAAT